MLVCFWSPKGGSGVSLVAAATALALGAQRDRVRLADLAGDQPAILGLASDPEAGLLDWLAAGAEAPAEALDRLVVDAGGGVGLLPAGTGGATAPSAEAGAALGVVLRDAPEVTVADLGVVHGPAPRALRHVADVSVPVLRPCYLALRRAVRDDGIGDAAGAVLVEEPGRSLGVKEVGDVLGLPVLASVPWRAGVARAVDAGVVVARPPDALVRPIGRLVEMLGLAGDEDRAA